MPVKWELDDLVGAGTSLRGRITADFSEIVAVFGEPNVGPTDKVWNEWALQFEVGDPEDDDWDVVEATIYDWKELYADASRMVKDYVWHIGGKDHRSVELVYEALGR